MFGREAEIETPQVGSRFVRLKSFVKRSLGVRVQVVHHQRDSLAFGVTRIEQAGPPPMPNRLSFAGDELLPDGNRQAVRRT